MIRNFTQHIQPSATLWINERIQQLRESGKHIYHFGFGQSPFPIPEHIVEALRNNAHQKSYLPVRGLAALRQEVAAFLSRTRGISFEADQILIGPGSKELLYLIQHVLEGRLYLPSPSWVSYEPQAHYTQHPITWLLDEAWRLSPTSIRQHIQEPGYCIFNYPSNPTGVSYTDDELQKLAEAFREKGTWVIADEIYGMLHFDGKVPTLCKHYPEGTIITTGLSKWCGAGGWRLGVAAFPKERMDLLKEVAVMASETYSCAAAPIQYAALTAYRESPKRMTTYAVLGAYCQK
ncbi:MAG: pyridoxal phosphate-dependent aminotransferase [Saprospiraceae bacterium]